MKQFQINTHIKDQYETVPNKHTHTHTLKINMKQFQINTHIKDQYETVPNKHTH